MVAALALEGGEMRGELLPCPFCGGEAFIDVMSRDEHGEPLDHSPECGNCAVSIIGAELLTEAEAITAWNTRTPSPEASRDAVLEEALRECADKLWVLRCNSRDELDREAAQIACDMATAALKPPITTPTEIGEREAQIEAIAQAIYEYWQFGQWTNSEKPAWITGGNSVMQDLARGFARAAIRACTPSPEARAVEDEREACAKVAEDRYGHDVGWHHFYRQAGNEIAALIRSRPTAQGEVK